MGTDCLSLLWLGSVCDGDAVLTNRAISPASNNWQIGLLRDLQPLVGQLRVLGHPLQQLWPKGNLMPKPPESSVVELQQHFVDYLNLPLVRTASLCRSLRKSALSLCREACPDFVLAYNPYPWQRAAAQAVQERLGVPWICVVADIPSNDWDDLRRATCGCSGYVFLSYRAYEQSPLHPKLHLDGGIPDLPTLEGDAKHENDDGTTVFLYAGSMSYDRGTDQLIEAFNRLDNPKAMLWLCGKSSPRIQARLIRPATAANRRIIDHQLVDEEKLAELMHRADVFVNPRPPDAASSFFDFPSKVSTYLSYQKPVISNRLPGLSPEYDAVLHYPDDTTPAAWAEAMGKIMANAPGSRDPFESAMETYVQSHRWSIQAKRLKDWITTISAM